MNPSNGSSFARRMLNAAAMVTFAGALYACGGGGSSVAGSGELTQSQFDALLKTSTLYTDLTAQLKDDEEKLATVSQIGHVPGAAVTRTAMTDKRTMAITRAVDTTDYGVCPNMGVHIANLLPPNITHDAITGNSVDVWRQCDTGSGSNEYLTDSETAAIATIPTIWYPLANCQGTPIEFEAQGVFDRPTLEGGIVFKSPADGAVRWVKPLQAGQVATSKTSHSFNSGGACTNFDLTAIGYDAVLNVTDGANGSGVPNGGLPTDYTYN